MVANSSPDGEDVKKKKKKKKKKLAVFVSGRGSNFRAIHEACVAGTISGEVAAVVTEKSGCAGAVFARDMDIPVLLFPKTKQDPDALSASDLIVALRRYEVDFILLAGYLKLIPIELIKSFPKSIINTHPSLLPAFGGKGYYGMKVHDSVIASGARYSGPTIHFIGEHYDRGCILAQRVIPVLANDTAEELATRVLQVEHRLYVETVAALCEERIVWREDGIPLIRSIENPELYSWPSCLQAFCAVRLSSLIDIRISRMLVYVNGSIAKNTFCPTLLVHLAFMFHSFAGCIILKNCLNNESLLANS
ncbi:phosphoribosylglycinamide formyltransferase, chloroplastic-like [Syzygium oleosum]|uniref:phosphoribosylglycinamide formyltransferase, chloroplastic-like n=1 Tax=Syzygium oleosum TaxID=219896 RepID=UPI0011D27676|nr:phosphoribosylglycinamide formyltransferase, chloroplastic-like [Syzygium oleosum]